MPEATTFTASRVEKKSFTSVDRAYSEIFSDYIVEVYPGITDKGRKILSSLGAAIHKQVQQKNAAPIVLISDDMAENFGEAQPFEGFSQLSGRGLKNTLQVGGAVL